MRKQTFHTEHEAAAFARKHGGCYGFHAYAGKGGYWAWHQEKPEDDNFTSFGVLPTPA